MDFNMSESERGIPLLLVVGVGGLVVRRCRAMMIASSIWWLLGSNVEVWVVWMLLLFSEGLLSFLPDDDDDSRNIPVVDIGKKGSIQTLEVCFAKDVRSEVCHPLLPDLAMEKERRCTL